MASGTPCLNSRWDQPKSKADLLQGIMGNVSTNNAVKVPPSSAVTSGASSPAPSAPAQGGVEMATAMAAKLNAMLLAKGKLKAPQPLPSKAPPSAPVPVSSEEIVVTEVDINDVPVNCRNLLTKSKTQEEIRLYSGALVSTKGLFLGDAEKSTYKGGERPLYLHVQGRSQDEVNKAVMRIKEIISEDVLRASGGQQPAVMPPVPVYPQPPRPSIPPQPHLPTPRPPNAPVTPAHRPPPPHAGSFVHTKLFVGLEQCLPDFNVNEKVEGPNGSYLQHIQTETGARVFLRGKGSGYIEQASRRESFEPLYLYISHPNSAGLESAKKLCESLLETVRAEHARMVSVYTATGSTQATYQSHGYSSSTSSSYSSQSWYGYPSVYPSYPGTGSYWSRADGADGAQMVQYPVCPRKPTSFVLQDEVKTSDDAENDSSSVSSPKRCFIEESEEEEGEQELTQEPKPDGPVEESLSSGGDVSRSDLTLMPPPPLPVVSLPAPLKRPRQEPGHSHADEEEVKKVKISSDSLGLVPYGGDSSDEEEEKSHSGRKSHS
ncbi:KH homology domain-containing protein 4-like isoform X1 [Tachysurus fulvidraco]|uniref:KH homology domain-containing protein 4-like isoform X1 n=1 Tax=Tachysurus fulvidraco TaxID=1234273 RepID=UPI000F4D850C|nr:KH homology domain-containing protein 4-like isoform X1 [Tachysurus fulvidraco]XP_047678093.1 KH homology domain-containing protein 4-like isoform X1 [Tachysurus fulvidraco]